MIGKWELTDHEEKVLNMIKDYIQKEDQERIDVKKILYELKDVVDTIQIIAGNVEEGHYCHDLSRRDEIREIIKLHRKFYGKATYIIEDEHIEYLVANLLSSEEARIKPIREVYEMYKDSHNNNLVLQEIDNVEANMLWQAIKSVCEGGQKRGSDE